MIQPEALSVPDFSDFDFDAYEQQLQDVSVEANAQAALANILTVQSEDGASRSYEQIQSEAEVFFSNPVIIEADRMLDNLAAQYAAFCMAHGEGGASMNDGPLSNIFERGANHKDDGHNHQHSDTIYSKVDDKNRSSKKKEEREKKRKEKLEARRKKQRAASRLGRQALKA